MATPALGFQNWYSTTLSTGITASETTIYLNSLPTPSEGYLVIEPDSVSNREIIYYTSKGANFVTLPSVGAGRGVGGTTAVSHSSGVTAQMNIVAEHLTAFQDGTAITDSIINPIKITGSSERIADYVASGGIWSGDAYASTRNASMTALVCYISGQRGTVAAVTARSFTASKDTYVDVLNTAGTFSLVYTEVTNNAASPALASNSLRLGIVVTGASNIAAAASINQGQADRVLPIASSIAYTTTDSLGNLIYNRVPQPVLIGYRQITGNFTTASASEVQITGLTCPVIVPANRRIKITVYSYFLGIASGTNSVTASIWDGTVGSGTNLQQGAVTASGAGQTVAPGNVVAIPPSPAAGLKTYNAGLKSSTGTATFGAAATAPGFIAVELV